MSGLGCRVRGSRFRREGDKKERERGRKGGGGKEREIKGVYVCFRGQQVKSYTSFIGIRAL